MTWVVEQPLPILFIGALLVAVAAGVWSQTRHRYAVLALAVFAVGTLGLLALEYWIITDAEQVEARLQQIARDLESNDAERVVQSISSQAPQLRQEVLEYLRRAVVQRVSIKRNLVVRVFVDREGKKAESRFNAVATVQDRAGLMGTHVVPRFLIVHLRLEQDDQWRVHRYEIHDPRRGI